MQILCVGAPESLAQEAATALDQTDGFAVESYSSAMDCLDAIKIAATDCVISANQLGDTDGLTLLQTVREIDTEVPFLLLANDADVHDASDAISAGVTDFFVDGIPSDLGARVEAAVEKYRGRQQLSDKQALYERIVEQNSISTVVINRDGEVILADTRASDRLGFDEFDGTYTVGSRDIYDAEGTYIPPAERPYMEVFETGEPLVDWECQIELADGDRRWIAINAIPITDDDTVARVIITSRDITDRKERAEKLREEKEHFERLVQEVKDYAIFRLDPDGYVRSWNAGAENIKGYDAEDIIGEHFSTFYTDDAVAEGIPERNLRAAREHGRVEDEGWRVRQAGSRFWANVIITAIRDEDGNLEGFSKITRDMTERRNYEQRLREEKERFERLVQEVKDYAIFRLDTDGYVTSWNDGAKNIKGYDAEEIIGEHFSTFYTDDAVAEDIPERNLRAAYEQGRIEDEGWRVRQDGSRFWANVVITAIHDEDGSVEGYSKVTRDMTERHEYEEQLEYERERLEFVNRLIRHNLLNSLNVVNARAQIIEDFIDPEAQSHLTTVQERTENMIGLIETLRSLMKVLVENEDRELESIPLDAILANEVDAARNTYPGADIHLQDDLPSHLVAADDLLEEVFENLIDNAIQHNDADTPQVWIDVDADPNTVTVSIADNGPGVPEDMQESIFEKGEKGFESPGTGFGLYLVNEIIESYDGSIEVVNDARGATFRVTLSRYETAEATESVDTVSQ